MLNELKQFVKDNPKLVRMNKTSNANLFVLKYARSVFYNNTWNEFLENCRGTIVDDEFNIVSLPFTKIYNFGIEERAPKWSDDTEVEYVRKVNGFMIACTWYENDLLWSTTGSIDSDFVNYARDIFAGFTENQRSIFRDLIRMNSDSTVMFECVHPVDPHIIPEETGLYLLGIREKKFDSPVCYTPVHTIWEAAGVKTIPVQYGTVADVIRETKTCTHEGFVMYHLNDEGIQESTKIKSPFYLMNKLFARGNTDRLLDGKAKQILDEEYYPLIDHVASNRESFKLMSEQERLVFTRKFIEEIL